MFFSLFHSGNKLEEEMWSLGPFPLISTTLKEKNWNRAELSGSAETGPNPPVWHGFCRSKAQTEIPALVLFGMGQARLFGMALKIIGLLSFKIN